MDLVFIKKKLNSILLLSWFDFFYILLWSIFVGLLLFVGNLLNILLLGELVWIMLYLLSSLSSISCDSIYLLGTTFFLLGLATGETAIALSVFILKISIYGNLKNSVNLDSNSFFSFRDKNINTLNSKLNR